MIVKVIGIIILISVVISGIYKSTTRHKVGYGLLAAWFLPLFFDSIHQKLWTYFETHKLAAEIYDPFLILILLVYGAVGIIEGLIRLVNDDFTFLEWISNLLKGEKGRQALIEREVSRLKSPSKAVLQTITAEDVRAAAVEMELDATAVESKGGREEAKSSQLLDYCEKFALKQVYWDSDIEGKVYAALRDFISDEYIIIPHESFSNIFRWKWGDNWRITDRVMKAHFDFAIYNEGFLLIMLIEVNGGTHNDSARVEMDEFKKKLATEKKLKLISIDATRSIGDVQLQREVEERIRQEFPDRDSCPTYCPTCHSRIPMILQLNTKADPNIHFYRCLNKECGQTHSLGRSGEYRKIAPLYRNMPDKLSNK